MLEHKFIFVTQGIMSGSEIATDWVELFFQHSPDKGLINQLYETLAKLKNKEVNNPIGR